MSPTPSAAPDDVRQTVVDFLARADKMRDDFSTDMPLYAAGVGLDSLETAELSATLEDVHGSDPYSTGDMPQTLDDIIAFYAAAPTGA